MRQFAIISNIAEGDVFNASPRSRAVFLVVAHFHLCDAPLFDLLNPNIVEYHVTYEVIVAAVDGKATLIVNLWFGLPEDINILVAQVLDSVATLSITVNTNEYRVSQVGPKG